ncbi:restriction endonuclease subunit S [Phormidium sp. FACHB-1136]|uniref:restriction endonuclease subunit S n=1 Tax=Phormidium sp. FACHB-1136 TaxID=2692848 RepID=UPI001686AFA5|nr:restriction endonuclease subunit S [Phormidium sp. FACHB-1136]MBD2429541.1 restriction endonuclease subunit S [Phormidium sp. FACHB-1136]
MKAQEIKTVGSAFNGKTPSKLEQRSEGLPILKIRDIDENGNFRGNFESFVDSNYYEKYSKKKLRAGDTIILNAAHNSDYVGSKNAFISPDLDGVVATGEWLIVRVDSAHPAYINHFLKSPPGRKKLKSCVKGIHLYPKDVERIKIPLPPLDDQKRIAYLLSKVEGLIAQRKQHLQHLDDLLKSVFLEMFGDPVRNEKGWEKNIIGSFARVGTGATPSRQKIDEYYNGDIPWVKTTEVKNEKIISTEEHITRKAVKETNCTIYQSHTILLAMYGQGKTRGQVGYLNIAAATNQACAAILPSTHNQVFIYEQLKLLYRSIRALGRGGNQENLNLALVKNISLLLPPIELQNQFSTIVEKVECIKTRYQASLADLENLYGALSQKAFKGELDLSRVPLPPTSPNL